jgi:ParB family chromosome partitioning protein
MKQPSKAGRQRGSPAQKSRYVTDVKVADITIGQRHRKGFGDLKDLAASVEEVGLLQPIGVTPDHDPSGGLEKSLSSSQEKWSLLHTYSERR